jgi:putative transposase
LGLNRSSWYYEPCPISDDEQDLLRLIDAQYTRTPFYGVRRMAVCLREQSHIVNEKRVRRLMRLMGIEASISNRN